MQRIAATLVGLTLMSGSGGALAQDPAGDPALDDAAAISAPSSDPGADDEPLLIAGGVLVGAGALAVVIGTTLGVVAAAQYGSLDCPQDTCSPAVFPDAEDYNALRVPSGITIAAGGLMTAIGGAFLYAVLSKPADDLAVRLELSPTSVGLRGSF